MRTISGNVERWTFKSRTTHSSTTVEARTWYEARQKACRILGASQSEVETIASPFLEHEEK